MLLSKRKFVFITESNDFKVKRVEVVIPEVVDPQYGLFTWPCAPILSQFLLINQDRINNKTILELGSGTGLASVVAAKLNGHVILSDAAEYKNCLLNCQKSLTENNILNGKVVPITWGKFSQEFLDLPDLDFILGSDCFYDKNDFENIIFTVAFLIQKNPNALFWTTYQIRSCDYSIEDFLLKWNLTSRFIPLESFNAAHPFIGGMEINHTVQLFEIKHKE